MVKPEKRDWDGVGLDATRIGLGTDDSTGDSTACTSHNHEL